MAKIIGNPKSSGDNKKSFTNHVKAIIGIHSNPQKKSGNSGKSGGGAR